MLIGLKQTIESHRSLATVTPTSNATSYKQSFASSRDSRTKSYFCISASLLDLVINWAYQLRNPKGTSPNLGTKLKHDQLRKN
jgi:hypothetical protein